MQTQRTFDIVRQISGSVVNLFRKKTSVCTSPSDGWALKMHYQWTFWIFLGGFSAIAYSWYYKDVIVCVSHFNSEAQVRIDYLNICLSYPYVLNDSFSHHHHHLPHIKQHQNNKRHLLFYRWVHWVFLLLAGVYYIPRKLSKTLVNPKIMKLFEDLAVGQHRYDEKEKENVERAAHYITLNFNTHNGLYYNYVFCNIVALFIDISCFCFLDFVFQGRFKNYGFHLHHLYRDPRRFTDPVSQTFPPFVRCTLQVHNQLTDDRNEEFGCHLTVMELYEKIFLFVWYWLVFVIGFTLCYIIYLLALHYSSVHLTVLRISKPPHSDKSVRSSLQSATAKCKVGDIYLLYRLKDFFSHARYYELLNIITNPNFKTFVLTGIKVLKHSNENFISQEPSVSNAELYHALRSSNIAKRVTFSEKDLQKKK